jgi:hypothetical protein
MVLSRLYTKKGRVGEVLLKPHIRYKGLKRVGGEVFVTAHVTYNAVI